MADHIEEIVVDPWIHTEMSDGLEDAEGFRVVVTDEEDPLINSGVRARSYSRFWSLRAADQAMVP